MPSWDIVIIVSGNTSSGWGYIENLIQTSSWVQKKKKYIYIYNFCIKVFY